MLVAIEIHTMSDKINLTNVSGDNSENLYSILRDCVHRTSVDSLADDFDCGASVGQEYSSFDSFKMISISDAFGDDILEENGRISLAYENLRSIPIRIAEKYATETKCLDLSYNNFHNLSFLTFFDHLHTLILDRNPNLDFQTLPHLSNLQILWINNCEIVKLDDWLCRIQEQCPNLRHLSMMGNRGANFLMEDYPDNGYREYVFNLLPNLTHLDGISRESPQAASLHRVQIRSSTPKSSSSSGTKKSLTSLKFCEFFRFKRKRNHHSHQNNAQS